MHTTHSNTQYKNESKHSEIGPVRENPILRTVSLFICVCIALCTIVAHNIAQNRPDSFPPCPPDNHHYSDDVYLREGGGTKAGCNCLKLLSRQPNSRLTANTVTTCKEGKSIKQIHSKLRVRCDTQRNVPKSG